MRIISSAAVTTMPHKPAEDGLYEVDRLVAKRINNGQTEYEVKWKGYSEKHNTWEPEENMKKKWLERYERSHNLPVKKTPKKKRAYTKKKTNKVLKEEDLESEEEYEVEKILDKKWVEKLSSYTYFVKWKGYDSSENCWISADDMGNCEKLLKDFEKRKPKHAVAKKSSSTPKKRASPKKTKSAPKKRAAALPQKKRRKLAKSKKGDAGDGNESDASFISWKSNESFSVETIIARKKRHNKLFYHIKWEGYPTCYNTWEPEENIPEDLVRKYEEENGNEQSKDASTPARSSSKRNTEKQENGTAEELRAAGNSSTTVADTFNKIMQALSKNGE